MEMLTICCVLLPVLTYKSLIQGENLRNRKCDLLTITQNISGKDQVGIQSLSETLKIGMRNQYWYLIRTLFIIALQVGMAANMLELS